jgi:hypothetical protein
MKGERKSKGQERPVRPILPLPAMTEKYVVI